MIVRTKSQTAFAYVRTLRTAITPRTTTLLLCSPSNPTGSMYSAEQLGGLADVVIERTLTVVSDEVYERLIYGNNRFASFPTVRPALQAHDRRQRREQVLCDDGLADWLDAFARKSGKSDGRPAKPGNEQPLLDQPVRGSAAVEGPQRCVADMLAEFTKRRESYGCRIAEIPDVSCPEMAGAFYAFINVGKHSGKTYGGERAIHPRNGA